MPTMHRKSELAKVERRIKSVHDAVTAVVYLLELQRGRLAQRD